MDAPEKTSNELAVERTDLAFRRTVMAADRTLMAWVRTGLSIISFGFTVYKILDALRSQTGATSGATPREVGMFMTAAGIIALALGVTEYILSIVSLRKEAPVRYARPSLIIAAAILIAGVMVFFGIQERVV